MKTPRHVIHRLAQCKNCKWTDDNYKSAARMASVHSCRYGHIVHVEECVAYIVKPMRINK